MRHDPALRQTLQVAEMLPPRRHNAPVYDNLPLAAYGIVAAAGGASMLAYWLTFMAQSEAAFMVVISTVYLVMYAGTPVVLARLGSGLLRARHGGQAAPSLADFLRGRMDTWTGSITGAAALVQVTLIPLGLAVATIGICVAVILAR
ncbi:hypothetical protein [Ferrovibrio sp.]|uniref:hypothetical protein n=1 Tax=Ferrovibrio sp. TaxID=1917215 RepID=UPI003D297BA2